MDSQSDKFAREDNATENGDAEPEPKFQFSLRMLFALTTVGAVGAFVIRLLWPSETFRLVFTALLFFSVPYGLYLYRNYRRLLKNWRNCQRKRQELENWAQEKSSHKAQTETHEADP